MREWKRPLGGEWSSLVAEIDEVVPKTKLEFGPDFSCSSPEPGTSLLQRGPRKGCKKSLLSLDEVFSLRESPTIHETLGLGEGRFVEGGNTTSESIDEGVQFVVG